ncbi:hypothetical protein NPIL_492161 [Nephila pilipes]|uniref:Uncharacterized protein n=1 Tax=Nephila pilipes TaxID=299642 RepID=A0A8X6MSH4_NEPPI|nr:hypothetical protein NPIL_492161 [Nephila pilipes]
MRGLVEPRGLLLQCFMPLIRLGEEVPRSGVLAKTVRSFRTQGACNSICSVYGDLGKAPALPKVRGFRARAGDRLCKTFRDRCGLLKLGSSTSHIWDRLCETFRALPSSSFSKGTIRPKLRRLLITRWE